MYCSLNHIRCNLVYVVLLSQQNVHKPVQQNRLVVQEGKKEEVS